MPFFAGWTPIEGVFLLASTFSRVPFAKLEVKPSSPL